ncbi:hypothetical protein [Nakamurella endophytica]|uniref:Uncharacterized protein n=1 Tax=Nakamurella endophytica TaxID=1748367 RepID=A0A917TAD3_9ACTN|nr:hypothetical protein [Nakamurella endophytica]GGM15050.1 hypothetical protein GCM10011594_38820 [Nakamurella endophytica]
MTAGRLPVRRRRRGPWWTAQLLLVGGVGWLITDRLLRHYRPRSWGGPNIGGGALSLLAAAVGLLGLGLVIADVALERRSRPTPVRFVAWVLDVVALGALLAVWFAFPAGDWRGSVRGQVGVTVAADGSPVLVLEVCRGSVDRVTVVGPNRGAVPNERRAALRSPAPIGTPVSVDLRRPPPGWITELAWDPATAHGDVLQIGSGRGRDGELWQVDWSVADLRTLDAGTVQYSRFEDGRTVRHRVDRAGFPAVACPPQNR